MLDREESVNMSVRRSISGIALSRMINRQYAERMLRLGGDIPLRGHLVHEAFLLGFHVADSSVSK